MIPTRISFKTYSHGKQLDYKFLNVLLNCNKYTGIIPCKVQTTEIRMLRNVLLVLLIILYICINYYSTNNTTIYILSILEDIFANLFFATGLSYYNFWFTKQWIAFESDLEQLDSNLNNLNFKFKTNLSVYGMFLVYPYIIIAHALDLIYGTSNTKPEGISFIYTIMYVKRCIFDFYATNFVILFVYIINTLTVRYYFVVSVTQLLVKTRQIRSVYTFLKLAYKQVKELNNLMCYQFCFFWNFAIIANVFNILEAILHLGTSNTLFSIYYLVRFFS